MMSSFSVAMLNNRLRKRFTLTSVFSFHRNEWQYQSTAAISPLPQTNRHKTYLRTTSIFYVLSSSCKPVGSRLSRTNTCFRDVIILRVFCETMLRFSEAIRKPAGKRVILSGIRPSVTSLSIIASTFLLTRSK